MKDFFSLDHPSLRPLWIRVLCTVVPFLWGLFEYSNGAYFWGTVFVAASAWCGYSFFLKPRSEEGPGEG